MVMVLTYGTVIVQVAFPFTLFNRRVKNVLLIVMIGEHAGIALLLGLPFFSMAMIAADAVFLPTAFLVWLGTLATIRQAATALPAARPVPYAGEYRDARPRGRYGRTAGGRPGARRPRRYGGAPAPGRRRGPYARRVSSETGRTQEPPAEPLQYDEGYGQPIGVGPHPLPWPDDERYDPELLAQGDRRNVGDAYRYWTREAIVADLDLRRHDFHVAVENWTHDFNIGSVVRTANAFLAKEIHIVGRRRWNRRGAMVTDRYQHVRHHSDTADLTAWATAEGLPIIGIDNLPGAVPLERTELPRRCVLLFGQEGPGLTEEAREHATTVCSIAQFGSTRSINAGAAAAIAMHAWIQRYADVPDPRGTR
ncbi:tRNA (guanosine(18)-2'-O)-methyltransferase [Streptomyces badius]